MMRAVERKLWFLLCSHIMVLHIDLRWLTAYYGLLLTVYTEDLTLSYLIATIKFSYRLICAAWWDTKLFENYNYDCAFGSALKVTQLPTNCLPCLLSRLFVSHLSMILLNALLQLLTLKSYWHLLCISKLTMTEMGTTLWFLSQQLGVNGIAPEYQEVYKDWPL
jgi:hypothetical protein